MRHEPTEGAISRPLAVLLNLAASQSSRNHQREMNHRPAITPFPTLNTLHAEWVDDAIMAYREGAARPLLARM